MQIRILYNEELLDLCRSPSEIKVATMGWACGTDERDKECIQNVGGETFLKGHL